MKRVGKVRREALTLYFVCKDPRAPWYAKAIGLLALCYIFSPIQLIPDYIPVIGFLDDLIVIWIGFLVLKKLTPEMIVNEARTQADEQITKFDKVTLRFWRKNLVWILPAFFIAIAAVIAIALKSCHHT